MRVEFLVTLHYLRPRGASGVIALFSMLGIALGVAILIVSTSVMNGLRTELVNAITSVNGHVNVYGNISEVDVLEISSYPEVLNVLPTLNSQALIRSKYSSDGVFVRGVRESDVVNIADKVIEGNIGDFHGGVLIGSKLANTLRINVGDEVDIFSGGSMVTMFGAIPILKVYTVVAIVDLKIPEYDSKLVYMPIDMAKVMFDYHSFNNADVYIQDPEKSDLIASKISELLGLQSSDWKSRGKMFEALETEKAVMFLILAMIVLVSSFNIVTSLIMLVQDKRCATGILRTIGATKCSIVTIFFMCGSIVGIIGTCLGLICGVVFANNIGCIQVFLESFLNFKLFDSAVYLFDRIPSDVVVCDVVKITVLSLFLSLISPLIPSIKAVKESPSQALKFK